MFTGIITHLGNIENLTKNSKRDLLLEISVNKKTISRKLEIGCSIACNGICLTLVAQKISGAKSIFSFQASDETCSKTTLNSWKIGDQINLEFALRLGDELGGHMVLGHVDGVAKITTIKKVKDSHQFTFTAPTQLMKFISAKGSATLDGISLTVNTVQKNSFSINAIPHTLAHTNLQNAKVGDSVNLEIDTIARYLSKLMK